MVELNPEQMGAVGPFYDRLPHFRIDAVPAGGDAPRLRG